MAKPFAFVTLLTSDSYLPGALALAGALKDVHPSPAVHPEVDFQTVCLVTPESVDVATIKLLRRAFNVVIGVELIGQDNEKGLQLLGESIYEPTRSSFGDRFYWAVRNASVGVWTHICALIVSYSPRLLLHLPRHASVIAIASRESFSEVMVES